MRTLLCELNRIHSHLVWLGTVGARAGCDLDVLVHFRERDTILDLFEMVTGVRMHTRYFQVGGLAEDIPPGFYPQCRKFFEWMPKARRRVRDAARPQRDLARAHEGHRAALRRRRDRARPVGARCCARRASTGTCASDAAVPRLRTRSTSSVPVYENGDVYDRYRVHMDEMRESTRIVDAVPRRLERMKGAVDRGRPQGRAAAARGAPHLDGVADPPLQDRHRGLPRPRGRGVRRDRVAARRAGLLPRLRRRPEAVARPVPRAVLRRARGDGDVHARRARRRPDRDRRLARHRHGRQSTGELARRSEEVARAVPGPRSAVAARAAARAGALRLALAGGARGGRRRARAHARLLPFGRVLLRHVPPRARRARTWSRSARTSAAALVGAQAVLEAFESELGVAPGETTADGDVTLRAVECLGGCCAPTVVAVDHRYRAAVTPEDVPGDRRRSSREWLARAARAFARPRRRGRARRSRDSPSTAPSAATRCSSRRARWSRRR